jgi:hypothetical protein
MSNNIFSSAYNGTFVMHHVYEKRSIIKKTLNLCDGEGEVFMAYTFMKNDKS